jgi:hypothetical protein
MAFRNSLFVAITFGAAVALPIVAFALTSVH